MKFILTISLLLTMFAATAQNTDTYRPLECSGAIPKSFITPSSVKYQKEIEQIEKSSAKKKEKKRQKTFSLESNFILDDLLQSGRVLYNDEVTVYLNEVVNQLLAAQPLSVKQTVQVYTLRSTAVNAFATDRGDIFVTLGMIAQLENEAQLAYILSHELVHIEEKHALSMYLESHEIDEEKRSAVLDRSVFDQKILAKCAFSKEQENEADKAGITRFLKTKYSTNTLSTVFDVLKYSYLPFDDVAFDQSFFQGQYYQFPADYWLEKINEIKGDDENEDDSKSTHPNIANRRAALAQSLEKVSNEGKSNYLISEQRFNSIRRRSRMELPMLYLHNDQFPQAVYNAYLLLKSAPADLYLQKCVLKSLYVFSKMRNNNNFDIAVKSEKIEGQMQQLYHLLEKMPVYQTSFLALRYGWQVQQNFSSDQEIKTIVDDLFFEVGTHYNIEDFRSAPPAIVQEHAPADTSKYDKIKKQNDEKMQPGGLEYWRYAFSEWLDSESFKDAFAAGEEKVKAEEDRKKDYLEHQNKYEKEEKRDRKRGTHLGIEKVTIVNPFYLKLDERKDNAVQFVRTEEGQEYFREKLREVSKISDLKIEIMDVAGLKEKNGSEAFNDIRYMNEWFAEQIQYYDLSLTPGMEQERINQIAEKYQTDYFLWTGIVSLREQQKYVGLKIFISLLYPVVLPFTLYSVLKPKNEMLYYAILYDVKTGRRKVINFESFDKNDTNAMVKAHLYDTFSQIRKKTTKK